MTMASPSQRRHPQLYSGWQSATGNRVYVEAPGCPLRSAISGIRERVDLSPRQALERSRKRMVSTLCRGKQGGEWSGDEGDRGHTQDPGYGPLHQTEGNVPAGLPAQTESQRHPSNDAIGTCAPMGSPEAKKWDHTRVRSLFSQVCVTESSDITDTFDVCYQGPTTRIE